MRTAEEVQSAFPGRKDGFPSGLTATSTRAHERSVRPPPPPTHRPPPPTLKMDQADVVASGRVRARPSRPNAPRVSASPDEIRERRIPCTFFFSRVTRGTKSRRRSRAAFVARELRRLRVSERARAITLPPHVLTTSPRPEPPSALRSPSRATAPSARTSSRLRPPRVSPRAAPSP